MSTRGAAISDVPRRTDGPEVAHFEFHTPEATFAGWATVTVFPSAGLAWYWAAVIREGEQFVTLFDEAVPLPRRGLELRTSGLWADHVCETPDVHWSVGLEAFAVGLDDPAEALGSFRGDRVPLGFDLEWESDEGGSALADGGRWYPCVVHGEVLLGHEDYEITAVGARIRRFGPTGVPTVGEARRIVRTAGGESEYEASAVPPPGAKPVGWGVVGVADPAGRPGAERIVVTRSLFRSSDGVIAFTEDCRGAETIR